MIAAHIKHRDRCAVNTALDQAVRDPQFHEFFSWLPQALAIEVRKLGGRNLAKERP